MEATDIKPGPGGTGGRCHTPHPRLPWPLQCDFFIKQLQ